MYVIIFFVPLCCLSQNAIVVIFVFYLFRVVVSFFFFVCFPKFFPYLVLHIRFFYLLLWWKLEGITLEWLYVCACRSVWLHAYINGKKAAPSHQEMKGQREKKNENIGKWWNIQWHIYCLHLHSNSKCRRKSEEDE